VPLRQASIFFACLPDAFGGWIETDRRLSMFAVVSEVLISVSRIFIEFERKPRNCTVCILNDFQRLPIVLALFSPN
jgi:hypothetical protein